MGIEPTYSAWEADVLPLNYTRDAQGNSAVLRRGRSSKSPPPLWYLMAMSNIPEQVTEMEILVNGSPRNIDGEVTVAALLEQLGCAGRRVAVEVNEDIVPRSVHAERRVRPGDRIEIVQAIGGG